MKKRNRGYESPYKRSYNRITEENRGHSARNCSGCIDKWTCMRFERTSRIGCEAKLLKGEIVDAEL
jgi:hypothetical protein